MNLIPINENFIKEVLYKYYNNDKKVNNEYFKLTKCVYEQTKSLEKNITFFLTELCIKDINYHSKEFKYLHLWNSEYTQKLLENFQLSDKSLRIGLLIYDNISTLFKVLLEKPKKMFFLSKEEYINIHDLVDENYDLNYYYACKKVFNNDYHILDEKISCIDDKHILNINNKNIVILPESLDVMYKLSILLNKNEKNIKLCNCNSFHTNEEKISIEESNFYFTYSKIKYKRNIVLEFNGNNIKYELYQYIKYIL